LTLAELAALENPAEEESTFNARYEGHVSARIVAGKVEAGDFDDFGIIDIVREEGDVQVTFYQSEGT